MLKVAAHPDYPPEEGCYILGNDRSPVAVLIILKWDQDEVPPEIEVLVRAGAKSGAALSGTLQTEHIGLEKVICNMVSNPNIRYLVMGGPESPGHITGDAISALFANGVDEKQRIIGTESPHPFLFNISREMIERFREQLTLVDLQFQGDPDLVRKAVWSCYQEEPVEFMGYRLYDTGAYPEPAMSGKITWRILQPYWEPEDENQREAKRKAEELMERIRRSNAECEDGGVMKTALMRTPLFLLVGSLVLALLFLGGCGSSKTTSSDSSGTQWVRSELYLGRQIPGGGQVSDAQLSEFVDKVITRDFPAGLTIFDAYGQMRRSDGGITRQPTKAILIVHEKSKANSDKIQSIISAYQDQFGKPQVMYLFSPTTPQFLGG